MTIRFKPADRQSPHEGRLCRKEMFPMRLGRASAILGPAIWDQAASLRRSSPGTPRMSALQDGGRAGGTDLYVLNYSHSIVPGGLLVTSSTTRFTSRTSFVIRVEIVSSTS